MRPYQSAALEGAREAYRAGARSVLLVAPTGAGKGTIAAAVLAASAARGKRAAFIVHRAELVRDIAARIRAAGVDRVSVEMGGETARDPNALVTVGTVQTFAARAWADEGAELLVVDEAHHATCSTYRALVSRMPRARVLGLTATPQRADGTALGDAFDRLVVAASIRELTDAGHLVESRVIAPATRSTGLAGSPLDAYLAHAKGRRTIVFASTIAHASRLAAEFADAGIRAAAIDSEIDDDERRAKLAMFAAHELDVLVNVAILTEGYDDPSVACVLLARGVGSVAAWLQIVGRALRPCAGKRDALILDLAGSVHEHGLPADDREWSLEGTPIGLRDTEERIRQCAECGSVFRASEFVDATCPHCGAIARGKPDPKVVRAQLEEIKAARLARLSSSRHVDFLRDKADAARAKGWKPGSAIVAFKWTFGRFPSKAERAAAGL